MKHKTKLAAGLAALALLLCTSSLVFAQLLAHYEAVGSRFASGGGTRQSTNYLVQDILGQWISESSASPNAHIIPAFFWAGDGASQQLYLPIVVRH